MILKFHTEVTNESDDELLGEYFDWLDSVGISAGIKNSSWSNSDYNLDFHAVAFPATVKRMQHIWVEGCSVPLKPNATWLEVWKQADKLIKKSGDLSHYFIEDFDISNDGTAVRFFAGS